MNLENYNTIVNPVETGLTAGDHAHAFYAFETFLNLPLNIKEKIIAGSPERNRQAGYMYKPNAADKKEVFHYTDRLGEVTAQQKLPAEAKEFLEVAMAFHNIAVYGLRRVLHESEKSDILEPVHFAGGNNNHHLRFVAYEPREDDQPLAEGHYDMSTLTVALCETHTGLRLGTTAEDLELYQRNPDQAVLFAGRGWLKLHEMLGLSTDLLPTWHDVVQADSVKKSSAKRMAAILFGNPTYLNTAPDMNETKKPLDTTDIHLLEKLGVLQENHTDSWQ